MDCTTEFKKKHRGLDLGADYLALERLYDAAEATKMELSNRVSSSISLPFITADMTGPKHMDVTLTRSQYEAVVDPVLRRLDDPCAKILRSTNLKPSELQVRDQDQARQMRELKGVPDLAVLKRWWKTVMCTSEAGAVLQVPTEVVADRLLLSWLCGLRACSSRAAGHGWPSCAAT